jgi:hypothetical protein
METEGSLPHLQEPATCLYPPEPDELGYVPSHPICSRALLSFIYT